MSKLTDYIEANCTSLDLDKIYDEALDSEGDVRVGGLTFSPSQIIKELDPTAYRCGRNDYVDSLGTKEVGNETYDGDEVDRAAAEFIDELESELSDLESEAEEAEDDLNAALAAEEDYSTKELDEFRKDLAVARDRVKEKQDEIAEAREEASKL